MADISPSRIHEEVYQALFDVMVNDKPRYSNADMTTITYTISSFFRPDDATYPQMVINPTKVSLRLLTTDGSGEEYMMETQFDFYSRESHGAKAIDAGRAGALRNILARKDYLFSNYGFVLQEDPWEDSTVDVINIRDQTILTASSVLRGMLRR